MRGERPAFADNCHQYPRRGFVHRGIRTVPGFPDRSSAPGIEYRIPGLYLSAGDRNFCRKPDGAGLVCMWSESLFMGTAMGSMPGTGYCSFLPCFPFGMWIRGFHGMMADSLQIPLPIPAHPSFFLPVPTVRVRLNDPGRHAVSSLYNNKNLFPLLKNRSDCPESGRY